MGLALQIDEHALLSHAEMRRRLQKYIGERHRHYPESGVKSDKIHIWDIALLTNLQQKPSRLWNFVSDKASFGPIVSKRLSRIIILLDNKMITKTQYGVYHFHEAPVAPVVKEMTFSLGGLEKKQQFKTLDINNLFGG